MKNPTTIIFVEDNPSDVSLFNYALSQIDIKLQLVHYEHGRDFLDNIQKHYPTTISCILLDINMPFVNGWEVMEALNLMDDYKHIPIVMLTSSNANEDRQKAYRLGVNAFVAKPNELDDLCIATQRIVDFWVKTNERVI